jgi:hypothetical protein
MHGVVFDRNSIVKILRGKKMKGFEAAEYVFDNLVALLLEAKLVSVHKTADVCADYTVKNKVLLLQMEAIRARRRYVEGVYEVGSRMNVLLFYYDARSWMGIPFHFHGCLRLRERREVDVFFCTQALPKMWVKA